jgi:hypothetical protein
VHGRACVGSARGRVVRGARAHGRRKGGGEGERSGAGGRKAAVRWLLLGSGRFYRERLGRVTVWRLQIGLAVFMHKSV